MKAASVISGACLLTSSVCAFPPETGLTGFPANIYDPYCATACLRSLNTLTLNCSSKGVTVGMIDFVTSTECFAVDTPFLTSVAWCVHTKCADSPHDKNISASLLEYWWDMQVTGQRAAGVKTLSPKWTYAEALAQVSKPPTLQLTATDTKLNTTSWVALNTYEEQYNVLYAVQREGTTENGFGIAMLISGFGTPIILTWLGYVPFVSTSLHRLRPYLLWPSTIGTYHTRPLPYLIGNAPTVGQSLYIGGFVILNIIFTSVNYASRQPNPWYSDRWREIVAYVLYRTGNFAYIMAPLIFLFAGRNNILLWLTNWSHSTFILLHRWIARVFTFQALLHSILALVLYIDDGDYSTEHVKSYWAWGIVATIFAVVLTFSSGLHIRTFFYEAWLVVHIVLSVILVIACWYHAYDLYGLLGGYSVWIYAVSAVWAFDRFGRLARILITGPRRATVTKLGRDGYVRIDIPGVRWAIEPGKHAYFYFPTITPLQPWENHPFSVLPTVLLQPCFYRGKSNIASLGDFGSENRSSSEQAESQNDVEKHSPVAVRARDADSTVGLTIFVRKSKGMTKALHAQNNLLTLVEGPYPNNSTAQVLKCDRLLLISGGIGITAILPFIASHWNVKLAWSVKESASCLVDEFGSVLAGLAEKEVRIGSRLDVFALLDKEAEAGWQKVGVVVSGPGPLCDQVRATVVAVAKKNSTKTAFELEVEAYSW